MKIYFTLKSIPELAELSKDERKRLWSKYAKRALFHPRMLIPFIIYAAMMMGGTILSFRIQPWIPLGYIIAGLICGTSFIIFLQFWYPVVRIYLKEELKQSNSNSKTC